MNKNNIALYPGSFDPFHKGHEHVLEKACQIFEHIYIVLTKNINKTARLPWNERLEILKTATAAYANVTVLENIIPRLTTDLAKIYKAKYLIRGVRDNIDLEYELNLSQINHRLNGDVTTVFFVSSYGNRKISSSLIMEAKKLQQK